MEDKSPLLYPNSPSKINKMISRAVIGALVIIALGIGVFLFWSFQSEQVLDIKNAPIPTRSIREHPTAGGVVILDVDYCKKVDIKGRIRTSLVSSTREVFLPMADEAGPKGCKHTDVPVLLPKDIPPDTYKIKFRVTYDLNPVKRGIVQEFESQGFQIVAM